MKAINVRGSNLPNLFPPTYTLVRTEPKIGRNDPCPCGSGKKYKKCCLDKNKKFERATSAEFAKKYLESIREKEEK